MQRLTSSLNHHSLAYLGNGIKNVEYSWRARRTTTIKKTEFGSIMEVEKRDNNKEMEFYSTAKKENNNNEESLVALPCVKRQVYKI